MTLCKALGSVFVQTCKGHVRITKWGCFTEGQGAGQRFCDNIVKEKKTGVNIRLYTNLTIL